MKKFRNVLVAASFCFALTTPIVVASPAQDHEDRDHRYYDEEHKDYHNWDSSEQRYWHNYWRDQHKHYTSWDRASDEQRRDYWRWRHDHDHDHDDHR